ncbi:MAG: hypothetical protein C0511_17580 [Hyphomicrobium sp.]|nr:hypothetical protein [Hyphomicrobium sp.]
MLQYPIATSFGETGVVTRCRNVRAGPLGNPVYQQLPIGTVGYVATIDQDIAVGAQRAADRLERR